ncbi:extracellular solute-binding protein [Streptomyces sp. TRM 70351]|uniref:extracellular solute-binding protein n=1 Tax=Streptomyces sp. TRM 70351 TaxID=3116552 RepID=UPI002E7B46B4|nr:extracellular solute-binding protein [Streptomyces sp. TRM 70351]MEE1931551.1 extracellular solute-binding protein [Streptomyces sp. TRM 70351]
MSRTTRTAARATSVALAAMLLATACGRSGDSGPDKEAAALGGGPAKGKITMWSMGDADPTLEGLAKEFEKQNPDADVKITPIPWDAAHDKLTTAIAGGNGPDVSLIGSTWMAEMAAMNGFQATPDEIKPEAFFPGQWDTTKYQDTAYGVPFIADTSVIYYRTDIAAKAGITKPANDWDGFYKNLEAIQKTAGKQNPKLRYASGLQTGFNAWLFWLPMVWQSGGDIYDPQGKKFTFDTPEVAQALEYYGKIFKNKMAPTDKTDGQQGFHDGLIATLQQGASVGGNLHKDSPELDSKWQTMALPANKQAVGLAGGSDLAVFKSSDNKDAAWKFVRFLTEAKNLASYGVGTGQLPAAPGAWSDPRMAQNPKLAPFRDQLEVTKAPPAITTWQQIGSTIDSELEKLALGKATPADVQKALQSKATSIGTGR